MRNDNRLAAATRRSPPPLALFAAALAAVVVAAAHPAAAQEASAGGLTLVEVDLGSRSFDRTLPFDVPFLLAGPVPPGASLVEVRCWEARQARGLDAAEAAAANGDCWPPPGVPSWSRVAGVDDAAERFAVAVPRLDAEHHYRFKFSWDREVGDEEAEAFNLAVRRVLGEHFWERPFGDLDAAEGEALRSALIATLARVTAADRIVRTDSLFDPAVPFAEVEERFFTTLRGLLESEDRRRNRFERYGAARERLKGALLVLRGDAVFTRFAAALADLAEGDADLAAAAAEAAVVAGGVGEGLRNPRALGGEEELEEFLVAARPSYAGGVERLRGVAAMLREAVREDGEPGDLFLPLVAAAVLDGDDLDHLQALATAGGPLDRARVQAEILLAYVEVNLPAVLDDRRASIAEVAAAYETLARTSLVVAGSTSGDFATRHQNYVSLDSGLAWAPGLDDFVTYAGTNVYFRPVNKDASLNQLGSFRETLGRRFALTLGLTVEGLAEGGERPTRLDLFGSQSLVLGAGLRLTESLRLTAGAIVFRQRSPNPLSDDTELAVTPYVAVSFDVDVAPLLNGIGGRLSGGG